MATFLNTSKVKKINSLVESYKSRLDNPYNIYLNRSPSMVDWYNQCKETTSMDETTKEVWDYVGKDSPVGYNLIEDAVVYGIERMNINWNATDFGIASDDINGELVILPNTWVPYPNDYFRIKHIDNDLLFKVTDVTIDTFPNGANFYKVEFMYEKMTTEDINKQVSQKFKMILDNVGTEFNVIVKEDVYVTADTLDTIIINLQNYYTSIFFRDSLQTFVYLHDDTYFYDPYMVEFLRRNEILANYGGFVYINHELPLGVTFLLDYDKTFFRSIELKDKTREVYNRAVGRLIEDPNSIFYYRTTPYYEIRFSNAQFAKSIDIIDGVLLNAIRNNSCEFSGTERYKNILVKYFNDEEYTEDEIKSLESMDVIDNKDCFYYIPIVIYALTNRLQTLIKKK